MAHFAKLDENNVVLGVHVVHNNELMMDNHESEQKGINFLTNWDLQGHSNWKKCSYNTRNNVYYDSETGQVSDDQSKAFRVNFPQTGDLYNAMHDVFIHQPPLDYLGQSCESWLPNTISGTFIREVPTPPGPHPTPANVNHFYYWDESRYNQDPNTAWTLFVINEYPEGNTVVKLT